MSAAQKAAENIDVDDLKSKVVAVADSDKVSTLKGATAQTIEIIGNRASDLKDAAVAAKEDYDERVAVMKEAVRLGVVFRIISYGNSDKH